MDVRADAGRWPAQQRGVGPRETRAIVRTVAHRPWPLPRGPWVNAQSWLDLLFAHWPLDPERVRPLVPAPLELDLYEGRAWIGVVPFLLAGFRARLLPPIPGTAVFPEVNVRTYVRHGGKAGVWFFSLDAASRLAVHGARLAFGLPYFHADMAIDRNGGWIRYASRRRGGGDEAALACRYRPTGAPFEPAPGTLEHFLVERYALFALRRGRLVRGEIHHRPWTLRAAEAEIARATLVRAAGIELPDAPPLAHVAARQDSLIWPPRAEARCARRPAGPAWIEE